MAYLIFFLFGGGCIAIFALSMINESEMDSSDSPSVKNKEQVEVVDRRSPIEKSIEENLPAHFSALNGTQITYMSEARLNGYFDSIKKHNEQKDFGVAKGVWDFTISKEEAYEESSINFQIGMDEYREKNYRQATHYFKRAYVNTFSLINTHDNNPLLYASAMNSTVGIDYQLAIANGQQFWKLHMNSGDLTFDKAFITYNLVLKKMYKLLLITENYDLALEFLGQAKIYSNYLIGIEYSEKLLYDTNITNFFYDALVKNDYSVRQNIRKSNVMFSPVAVFNDMEKSTLGLPKEQNEFS